MTITIKVPFHITENHTAPTVWKGKKKLGELFSAPKVVEGKLIAGKCILANRDHDAAGYQGRTETILFTTSMHGKPLMEVHYADDYAIYELIPDEVVWSDGPPHPSHLQLAVRRSRTDGVEEP